MKATADEFRSLLRRGKLTGAAAAEIAGVNPRTIRRWIGGNSKIPYSAWTLIETAVQQAEIVAEATADHAAWIAAMDEPQANKERLAVLRAIHDMQHQRAYEMEDELAQARRVLAETNRRMSQAAERD